MAKLQRGSNANQGGWTLIALLIAVAIIAVLMVIYLPSLMQSYSPPETTDEQGQKKPVTQHVKEQLAPIDTRNKQLEQYLPGQGQPEENQDGTQGQDHPE